MSTLSVSLGKPSGTALALLLSVFIVASCGLAYELLAAALASHLLGDSITQFSTVIGAYLFAMGIGSALSRYLDNEVENFVRIELLIAVSGGVATAGLSLLFAYAPESFRIALYLIVGLLGILTGLEIPLVMRILGNRLSFKDLVSHVLTFDYLGALAISIAFPLFVVPQMGLIRGAFFFGLVNALVGVACVWLFRKELQRIWIWWLGGLVAVLFTMAGVIFSNNLSTRAEQAMFGNDILLAENTAYQRILITKHRDDIRLHLNGNLQFSSRDEYRYHEALVHPVMAALPGAKNVLVLGGGDGLAVREILKYPNIQSLTLIDLDPRMTQLFRDHPLLSALNEKSLSNPKVKIINEDAFIWLDRNPSFFDAIIIDLPDPSNFSLAKLYTLSFYEAVARHLSQSGFVSVQATSPLYARQAFWIIVSTLEAAGLTTAPYHATVPSFGEWGFVIAGHRPYKPPGKVPDNLRFITVSQIPTMFDFPPDMARVPAQVNRLDTQTLVRVFEAEWHGVLR